MEEIGEVVNRRIERRKGIDIQNERVVYFLECRIEGRLEGEGCI